MALPGGGSAWHHFGTICWRQVQRQSRPSWADGGGLEAARAAEVCGLHAHLGLLLALFSHALSSDVLDPEGRQLLAGLLADDPQYGC
jgi:hypothetical protein